MRKVRTGSGTEWRLICEACELEFYALRTTARFCRRDGCKRERAKARRAARARAKKLETALSSDHVRLSLRNPYREIAVEGLDVEVLEHEGRAIIWGPELDRVLRRLEPLVWDPKHSKGDA